MTVTLAVLGLAGFAYAVRRPLLMAAPSCLAGRWRGCFDTDNGVLLMMLVGLPVAALLAWALAHLRRAAGVVSAGRRSLAEVGLVYGTVPSGWRILALGAGCSVLVETAQYVFQLDRVSSVDDVLVNAAGAALAGLASRRWWSTAARAPSQQPRVAPAPVA